MLGLAEGWQVLDDLSVRSLMSSLWEQIVGFVERDGRSNVPICTNRGET